MADEALRIVKDAAEQDEPDAVLRSPSGAVSRSSRTLMWAVIIGLAAQVPAQRGPVDHRPDQPVNLGNAQILTIPGEALPNIGFYLKRKMQGEHNLLFGLTNDAFGYILTKVDFQQLPALRLRLADLARRDDRRDPDREVARVREQVAARSGDHASSPLTTLPWTSVSRKSRPWKR